MPEPHLGRPGRCAKSFRGCLFCASASKARGRAACYPFGMAKTADDLMRDVCELPAEERERFIVKLLDMFAPPEEDPEVVAKREAAWDAEIRRRIEDIDAGRTELIPADKVFAELTARRAARRKSA